MEVRCVRCQAGYHFEDALVSRQGTLVECADCGHQFSIGRSGAPGTDQWRVDTPRGQLVFHVLRELQQSILVEDVGPQDRLSVDGFPARPLGSIPELASLFTQTPRLLPDEALRLCHKTSRRTPPGGFRVRIESQSGCTTVEAGDVAAPPAPHPPQPSAGDTATSTRPVPSLDLLDESDEVQAFFQAGSALTSADEAPSVRRYSTDDDEGQGAGKEVEADGEEKENRSSSPRVRAQYHRLVGAVTLGGVLLAGAGLIRYWGQHRQSGAQQLQMKTQGLEAAPEGPPDTPGGREGTPLAQPPALPAQPLAAPPAQDEEPPLAAEPARQAPQEPAPAPALSVPETQVQPPETPVQAAAARSVSGRPAQPLVGARPAPVTPAQSQPEQTPQRWETLQATADRLWAAGARGQALGLYWQLLRHAPRGSSYQSHAAMRIAEYQNQLAAERGATPGTHPTPARGSAANPPDAQRSGAAEAPPTDQVLLGGSAADGPSVPGSAARSVPGD